MKGLAFFLILASGLSLSACQHLNGGHTVVQAKTYEFSVKENCPTEFTMQIGEVAMIHLPENPSTGYQWQLLQPLKNLKTETSYLQDDAQEGTLGAGGTKTFRFIAQKAGQDLIELVHVRAWESTKQPDQQWRCRIKIS